jgi:phosphate transport system permease protein
MTLAVVPLGVSTAIYLQEYAPKKSRWVHLVRLAIQNLAGVPAIVFGLFGLGFFIQFVGRGSRHLFF